MQDTLNRFVTAKAAEGASPHTIRSYRHDLSEFFAIGGILTRASVREHLKVLSDRGLSKVSASHHLASIKSLCRWLYEQSEIAPAEADRILGMRKPKTSRKLPTIPSVQQMFDLLDGEFNTKCPERDRLALELLYSCGLRCAEVTHLDVDDVHTETQTIRVVGKGDKERLVPIGRYLAAALGVYLPVRQKTAAKNGNKSTRLLIGRGKRKGITERSIGRLLHRICKARGLPPMHPHLLRDACATHLLDNGCPLEIISELLGHSQIDTTAGYAQVSTQTMMKSYGHAHPHANPLQGAAYNSVAKADAAIGKLCDAVRNGVKILTPKVTK